MHTLMWKSMICRIHAVALGAAVLSASPALAQTIFINELHYDNEGKDTGEVVEVAGPAKTDLTDWQLVFYNGKNGRPYRTVALDGSLPDLQNGYGALAFEVERIENGPSDGVALVDPDDRVVHFLSYEGSITASAGVAEGLPSIDIGVEESNRTTMAGHSLQLSGTGGELSDFQWENPKEATPGAVNNGQTFESPEPAEPGDIATRVR